LIILVQGYLLSNVSCSKTGRGVNQWHCFNWGKILLLFVNSECYENGHCSRMDELLLQSDIHGPMYVYCKGKYSPGAHSQNAL
jgi:hypothetical protein